MLLTYRFIDVIYDYLYSKTTTGAYGYRFWDVNSAEEACTHDNGCGGIVDYDCAGNNLYLCSIGSIVDSIYHTCVYTKTGNSYL